MRSSGLRAARPISAIATLVAVAFLGTAGPAKADRDELRRFLDVCDLEPVSPTHRYTYPTSYMRRAIAAVQEELSSLEDRMSSDLDLERMSDLESDIGRAMSALHCWERRLREAGLNPPPLPPREIIDAGDGGTVELPPQDPDGPLLDPDQGMDPYPVGSPDLAEEEEPTDTADPDGPFGTTVGTRWRLDTRLNLSGRDLTGFNFGQVGFPSPTGETVFDADSPTGFGFDGEIGLFATFPEPDGHDGVRPFAGLFGTIVYAEDEIDVVRDTAGGPALLGVSVDGVNAFQFNENAILNTDIQFWRAGGGVELGAELDVDDDWTLTPSVRGSVSYEETDIDSDINSDFGGGRFENTLAQLLRQRDLELEFRFGAQLRVAPDWLVSGTAGTGLVFRDSELESADCFDGNRFVGGCDGAGGLSQINTDRSEIGPTVSLAGALMFLYACDPENFVSNCIQLGLNAFFQNRPRTVIRNPTAQGQLTTLTSERGSAFGGGFQITIPLGY